MNKRHIIIFGLVLLCLTGCVGLSTLKFTPSPPSPSKYILPSVTLTVLPLPSVTGIPTRTQSPTAFPSTLTPTIINTPTVPPEARLKFNCLEVLPRMPEDERVEGILILSPQIIYPFTPTDPQDPVVFLNLEDGSKQFLYQNGYERVFHFLASPDRTHVAYRRWILNEENEVTENSLIIADNAGQIIASVPFQEDHWSVYRWIDNQTLAIRWREEDRSTSAGLDIIWLNPFTGNEEFITTPTKFPSDLYIDAGLLTWEFPLVYDAKLHLLAYPGYTESYEEAIILWDVNARQDIARYPAEVFESLQGPVWSPDEKIFAFAMAEYYDPSSPTIRKQELFSINQDGELSRLTHLTKYYRQVSIGHFSWSPDGRYIAFAYRNPLSDNEDSIAIFDMETQEVTDYCLPGVNSPALVWSPNGKQIVVDISSTDSESRGVILIDIIKGYAFQISEDMTVEDWIISP